MKPLFLSLNQCYCDACFNQAPKSGIFSLASPNDRDQRKGEPDAAFHLRISLFIGICLNNLFDKTRPIYRVPNGLLPIALSGFGAGDGKSSLYLRCL